jgi:hypothetical protein
MIEHLLAECSFEERAGASVHHDERALAMPVSARGQVLTAQAL